MSEIEEVKQRTDIVEVIGGYVALAKSGRNFKGICPFHQEKTPSFFVFPDRQSWHCFGACSTGGDVFSFIMKKENVGFGDALRLLAQRAGVVLQERQTQPPEEKEKLGKLYQINQAAAEYFYETLGNAAASHARQYLEKRGVSQKSVKDFKLGFAPGGRETLKRSLLELGYGEKDLLLAGVVVEGDDGATHDRFRNRLIFPIFDLQGKITGFGGRVLDDALPKYLNSPQTPVFDKSRSLYGINLAQKVTREADSVILVEGYLDVIIAHQYGFANVIAPMGTSLTGGQIDIIRRLSRNLILALDPDAAGEKAMLRGLDYKKRLESEEPADAVPANEEVPDYLSHENRLGAEVRVAIMPAGEDPDEVIRRDISAFKACLDAAVPVMDYAFVQMTAGLDLTTARGKTVAVSRLLPLVAEMKDEIRRDHYLRKLAQMTQTSYNVMEVSLNRLKSPPGLRRVTSPKADRDLKKALSRPPEEYCLTLLLRHPDLLIGFSILDKECFEDTRHREIFDAFQKSKDLTGMRETLDEALHDYLDYLINASVRTGETEGKFKQCALRLWRSYLIRLKSLAHETRGEVTQEDLAINEKIREIDKQLRGHWGRSKEVRNGRR